MIDIEHKINELIAEREKLKKDYYTVEEAKKYSSISSKIAGYKMIYN